ncbi:MULTISPECIES: anhydro-N-acetylmuramic acid kinase [unclassified Pedobacter]|uniref:anhydro-N-acetylmuramic acid kinase n=1 Tax=unclassified Pedobacter TaxID=2628915 RepID=UPI001D310292|nr:MULTISPECIES: anhydro-N-acetylmuramic acid kinase [unclassified Pedobacter]CAH0178426.1 Anhydro-N-acetylmuramic acid kinase [Pedobacter sp. Bi36]CAH0234431.1 Anhydro-N-acetylmuramic acid kinase [Pedobacter sp. Bi126]
MNTQIEKLYSKAGKSERLIIGLMSGTSMDGLDIALCLVKGSGAETDIRILKFKTGDYTDDFRAKIKAIFSKKEVDLQLVCLMNEHIANTHAQLINEALEEWGYKNEDIDFIASHGQTIFHAPKSLHQMTDYPNGTLQIGDGDHVALKTGIITLSDFRQKHLAAGGEGAPLAVYGDYLMFSKAGEDRVMLNIGGIANFTYLPGSTDASEIFSTDVGPGNTLMDQYMQKHFNQFYDKNAAVALAGESNPSLLSALLNCSFFDLDFPKTTGPELFNLEYLISAQEQSSTTGLSAADIMATLCHFSAETITNAIKRCFGEDAKAKVFMSGGGMHNPLLVKLLKSKLPFCKFLTTDDLNIDPDAKEAVLFAVLANETLCGKPINFGDRQGVPSVCMGKISLPA